ncbi:MAG: hypothetical protein WD078_04240 [Woeseia sp.]
MTPAAILGQLAMPVSRLPVLLVLLLFWVLAALVLLFIALFARVAPMLGAMGALLVVGLFAPALIRYLLRLLEATAMQQPSPVFEAAMLYPGAALWQLAPVVPVAVLLSLHFYLAQHLPAAAAVLPVLLTALLIPLSMAQLAMTNSPWQSINPAAMCRLLRRLGIRYLPLPLFVAAGLSVLFWLMQVNVMPLLQVAAWLYFLAAVSTLTGGVLATSVDIGTETDLPPPVFASPASIAAAGTRRRQQALNHAYALASRGNRIGCFDYLGKFADADDDPLSAEHWFLDAMLRWESRDAALHYAQIHIGHLLDRGYDVDAMKVIARCLREDAAFKPAEADRARVLAAAERLGNRDVIASVNR